MAVVTPVVGLVAWGWISAQRAEWWGAVGQWLGAVGSLAAAGVALLIAERGWKRADDERRDGERNQARLVFGEYKEIRGLHGHAVLYNRSSDYVHDVEVVEISEHPDYGKGDWFLGSPTNTSHERLPTSREAPVPPQNDWNFEVFFKRTDGTTMSATQAYKPVVTIRFTDANGRRWIRRGREEPQRELS